MTAQGRPVGAQAAVRFVRDPTTLLLYAALGVFGALQTIPSLATPALRAEFGYGYGLASLHLSAFAFGSFVSGLFGPTLDRRLGRRPTLWVGLLGVGAGSALLTAGQAAWATLAVCGVAGMFGTLVLIAVQSGLSDRHGDLRAIAYSESNVAASVGTTTAPLLVGAGSLLTGSWRAGVLTLALLALAVVILGRHVVVPSHVPDTSAAADPAARLPFAARAGVALVFCGVVLEWSMSYWGATYLRDVVGLARPTAVTAMVCFFGAMLVGRVAGGILARRWDPVRILWGALALVAAGVVVAALTTAPSVTLAALVVLGLGVSVLFPMGLALAVAAAPPLAAKVSGRCVTFSALAVLLGPLVVGRLADTVGLRTALLLLPVTLVGAALTLAATRATRPPAVLSRDSG